MKKVKVYSVKYFTCEPPEEGGPSYHTEVIAYDKDDILEKLQDKHPGLEVTLVEVRAVGAQG